MSEFAEGFAVGQSNGNNSWGNCGGDWFWIIILFCLFGWGNNGFGNGGNQQMGYDIGRLATTNDVASGFTTQTIMGNQREMQLNLGNMQNFINQGFYGLNTSVIQNGYETREAIRDLGFRMQDCCCQTERAIDSVNFNAERNKCDIINAFNAGVQRLVDLDVARQMREKDMIIENLKDDARSLKLGNYIVDKILPPARPAYLTCSPFQSAWGFPAAAANNGNGYGNSCWCN